MYLRGKFPYKHNKDIKKLMKQKVGGYVQEEECTDIIKYMYNEDDSNQLLTKLKTKYQYIQHDERELKKLSREERLIL